MVRSGLNSHTLYQPKAVGFLSKTTLPKFLTCNYSIVDVEGGGGATLKVYLDFGNFKVGNKFLEVQIFDLFSTFFSWIAR